MQIFPQANDLKNVQNPASTLLHRKHWLSAKRITLITMKHISIDKRLTFKLSLDKFLWFIRDWLWLKEISIHRFSWLSCRMWMQPHFISFRKFMINRILIKSPNQLTEKSVLVNSANFVQINKRQDDKWKNTQTQKSYLEHWSARQICNFLFGFLHWFIQFSAIRHINRFKFYLLAESIFNVFLNKDDSVRSLEAYEDGEAQTHDKNELNF